MIDGGTTKVYTHYCTVSAQAKRIRIIDRVCLTMRLDHPSRLSLTTCSHDPCSIHSYLTLLLLCNGRHNHVIMLQRCNVINIRIWLPQRAAVTL